MKRQMVEATLDGSESVSVVARRYDVNANQLFKWRRQYREGLLEEQRASPSLIPISVPQPSRSEPPVMADSCTPAPDAGRLEILLADGHRLVINGVVFPDLLRTALDVLIA